MRFIRCFCQMMGAAVAPRRQRFVSLRGIWTRRTRPRATRSWPRRRGSGWTWEWSGLREQLGKATHLSARKSGKSGYAP